MKARARRRTHLLASIQRVKVLVELALHLPHYFTEEKHLGPLLIGCLEGSRRVEERSDGGEVQLHVAELHVVFILRKASVALVPTRSPWARQGESERPVRP